MTTDGKAEEIRTTVAGRARQRAWREAERAISAVLADPEVQRLQALIEQEEVAAGRDLRDELQPFQDRYDHAVQTGDVAALAVLCPGKHGRWGRICVQSAGHETRTSHWGITPDGPVAWIGSAPDDD
ncbi:hypothetical protein [Streptomyces griseus]|uniref:hypothetical protein n=1 Tax=Streptomyces griseus TaxID=1911 RepID=UPI000897043E|nr:hypothetical protein [Streptomyces griseus]SEE23146.1 hypothetical protein SAMN04490359_2291 [Streptomyces griseus]SQA21847.1 Uncharacterised protein [Streptomyces griseus]